MLFLYDNQCIIEDYSVLHYKYFNNFNNEKFFKFFYSFFKISLTLVKSSKYDLKN